MARAPVGDTEVLWRKATPGRTSHRVLEVDRRPAVYVGSRKEREPAGGGGSQRPAAPAEESAFVEGEQTSVPLRN